MGPTQPLLGFGRHAVPEFCLLDDFSEFCQEGVWGHVDVYVLGFEVLGFSA